MFPYFVEILIERVPDGWTAVARFSRQADWRKSVRVPRAVFRTRTVRPTKSAAERAAVVWAEHFISSSFELLETSLMVEQCL